MKKRGAMKKTTSGVDVQQDTISVHGRLPRANGNRPVSTPIYQSATFQAASVDARVLPRR
jgi:hypothetical protein